ncbi:unnamed protein product [Parnassius apollo]|uniref:(apollo) hypothetical protein n=1 Tax=Parnassius apollo TaxID=110799 RepID=A0A8S3X5Z3_PARAO|nr:unnamed protein product [Parnassius apollo]
MSTPASTTANAESAPQNTKQDYGGRRKPNFKRPHNMVSNTLPPPRMKSTTETPLTNDPLWKDSFLIDGETGFVNELSSNAFSTPTHSYAVAKQRQNFKTMKNKWRNLRDTYKKYKQGQQTSSGQAAKKLANWQWAEQMSFIDSSTNLRQTESTPDTSTISIENDYENSTEAEQVSNNEQNELVVQELETARSTTETANEVSRRRRRRRAISEGRATAQTHGLYETLPRPGNRLPTCGRGFAVEPTRWSRERPLDARRHHTGRPSTTSASRPAAAQPPAGRRKRAEARAEAELDEENDDEGGSEPLEEETDDEADRVLPNVNLLGWRRSKSLNANQLGEINDVIVPDPDDNIIIHRYKINRELFELVERRLRE